GTTTVMTSTRRSMAPVSSGTHDHVLNESDTYREWLPPPAWRSMVACLWEQRAVADTVCRVIPDGHADVIVTGGGQAIAVGLAARAAAPRITAGSAAFGLRLRPQAVATVFKVPADELRNQEFPLDALVGTSRARRLADTVLGGKPDPLLLDSPPGHVARAVE